MARQSWVSLRRLQLYHDMLMNRIKGIASGLHVGYVVMSTTLDTEDKVIAQYGGSEWKQHEGTGIGFKIGESENITFPFTPDTDGIITVRGDNYAYDFAFSIHETFEGSTTNVWDCSFTPRHGAMCQCPARKGREYTYVPGTNGGVVNDVQMYFVPLLPAVQTYVWECTQV